MNEARAWHCSGQMQINGKIYIIVAGGHCKNSIETLDPSSSDQRWIYGENQGTTDKLFFILADTDNHR